MAALARNLRAGMGATAQNLRPEVPWQVIAAIGLMLLVHLGALWGIVAAHWPWPMFIRIAAGLLKLRGAAGASVRVLAPGTRLARTIR